MSMRDSREYAMPHSVTSASHEGGLLDESPLFAPTPDRLDQPDYALRFAPGLEFRPAYGTAQNALPLTHKQGHAHRLGACGTVLIQLPPPAPARKTRTSPSAGLSFIAGSYVIRGLPVRSRRSKIKFPRNLFAAGELKLVWLTLFFAIPDCLLRLAFCPNVLFPYRSPGPDSY